jgi:hypothetical protein
MRQGTRSAELVLDRVAFAVGVVGRLGESLLEALISTQRYSLVHVATRAPLESTLGKLRPSLLTLRSSDIAIPSPIDDVYCCIDLRPGFYGRDRAYATITAADLPVLARLTRAAGAKRFALVAPLTPVDQLSAPGHGVRDMAELDLVQAGFETLVLLRPADSGRPVSANLFQRIALGIGGVLAAYLIPQSMQPLRPDLVARAAIESLERSGPGTHVMNAPAIRELLALKEPPGWLRRRK